MRLLTIIGMIAPLNTDPSHVQLTYPDFIYLTDFFRSLDIYEQDLWCYTPKDLLLH